MNKLIISLAVFMLTFVSTESVLAKDGNSGSGGDGSSGGSENRVRIEVRAGEDDPEDNRVRVEVRGDGVNVSDVLGLASSLAASEDGSRIRIEVRGLENEAEDEAEDMGLEVNGNTFEATGTVTDFTGGTVTVDGTIITIDPTLVSGFEQEGTIMVGETIKVEGMVAADGSFLAREIEANGVEAEVEDEDVSGISLSAFLDQVRAFFQSLT